MEDLKSPKFRGDENNTDDLNLPIAHIVHLEFILLGNLLMSDTIVPKLISIIEKEGVAEVIQHYIKFKCAFDHVEF